MKSLFLSLLIIVGAQMALAEETPAMAARPPERMVLDCTFCQGTGQVLKEYKASSFSPSAKVKPLPSKCPVCGGARKCMRALTTPEKIAWLRQSKKDFVAENLKENKVPFAGTYLPKEEFLALTPEAKAKLAHEFPPSCKTCLGLGSALCTRCKGTGKGSKTKMVTSPDGEEIPKTDGYGHAIYEPCETCKGSGEVVCKKCEGSGLLPVCKRCEGSGLQFVEATAKKPAQILSCSSCKGVGRK